MYPRNFLCEEAKIKQRTLLKKELREIGEEAIWESRFTSFFIYFLIESWLIAKERAKKMSENIKLSLNGKTSIH